MNLSEKLISKQYNLIKKYHEKYLSNFGVKLPNLKYKNNFSKNALVLIYLSLGYPNTKVVSKSELTRFVNKYHKNTIDVQQARHLAAQSGFYIVSGQRNDFEAKKINLKSGEYKLISLEIPYPGYINNRRTENISSFEELKALYNHRCATCGSKENEPNIHWPSVITTLQKGHMNPNRPLTIDNIIPQCPQCNRADKNNWIYDNKGRVVSIANPNVVKTCSENIQKKIYKILKEELKSKD